MKSELKTITPDIAQKILDDLNIGNRAMSRSHVESLAKEMTGGRWKVNGDTICFGDHNLKLIDGQHRLAAVVLSGVTIQSWVITGLNLDVFDTKDVGKRRSAGDVLGIQGELNAYRLAAALIVVDKYITGRSDKQVSYSNTEVEQLLNKYPGVRDSIQTCQKTLLLTPSVMDACHYLFSQIDPIAADDFVQKITKGSGLEEGSSLYLLRERLVQNSLQKAKFNKTYLMALCIKAWNYRNQGGKLKRLYWFNDKGEPFPTINK